LGRTEMNFKTSHTLGYSLAITAAASFAIACADSAPVGPKSRSTSSSYTKLNSTADAASTGRFPDLGSCTQLQVPEGSNISFHAFGVGFQIYVWDGTTWKFSRPQANLYGDAGQNGLVGTHFSEPFAKPNWLTNSGSRVIGTLLEKCPQPNAIPWV